MNGLQNRFLLKLMFLTIFFSESFAQNRFLEKDPLLADGITIFQRMDSYKIDYYAFQKQAMISPPNAMLYSFLIPGLGQYLSGDELKGFIYIGIEATAWYMSYYFTNLGDSRTKKVRAYADDPKSGFDRVEYYRGIYEAVHGSGTAPEIFSLEKNETELFNLIKQNTKLYNDLKKLERDFVGDGVHTLPSTKTQQYYEQIGKYRMFYHGWLALASINAKQSKNINKIPLYIEKYYEKRDAMNSAYVKGTWALTAVMLNHAISAVEALISTQMKLKSKYKAMSYLNEEIPSLELTYQF